MTLYDYLQHVLARRDAIQHEEELITEELVKTQDEKKLVSPLLNTQ